MWGLWPAERGILAFGDYYRSGLPVQLMMAGEKILVSGFLDLRPAEPNDAEFLAWGLDEAAGGLFATMLGRRSRAILTAVMAQAGHQLSYEHAVVATIYGQVKGFCQGWPHGTLSADAELMRAAGLRALRAAAVELIGRPVFRALNQHSAGEWYLQAIAVFPQARGAGVGRRLVSDAFARAAAADCDVVSLDVDAANVRAQALYSRLGLRVVSTSPAAILPGGVQVRRMAASLLAVPPRAVEQAHQPEAQ
jgi:ribosomal protein S18 acetylase RimI-like enzyme